MGPGIVFVFFGLLGGSTLAPLFAAPGESNAVRPIPADGSTLELFRCLPVWEDATGSALPEDVFRRAFSDPCRDAPQIGFRDGDVWFKFRLRNATGSPLTRWVEYDNALARSVDFFVFDDAGRLLARDRQGYGAPATKANAGFHWPAFRVEFPARAERTLLIRVRADFFIRAYLRILSPEALRNKIAGRKLGYAAFNGIIAFMILITLLGFVFLRSPLSGVMALTHVFSMIFFMALDGFIHAYRGELPFAPETLTVVAAACSPVAACFAHFMFIDLMELRGHSPRLFRLFASLGALYFASGILYFFRPAWGVPLFNFISLPTALLTFVLMGYYWFRGMQHLRFILFGVVPSIFVIPIVLGEFFALMPPFNFELGDIRYTVLLALVFFALSAMDRMVKSQRRYAEDLAFEVKRKTAQLNEARVRAEEANKFKESLVRMVAHDLRSPLSAIKSNFPLLHPDSDLGQADRRSVWREMTETIDGVLRFAKHLLSEKHISESAWLPRPVWCDLSAIVDEAGAQARALFTAKNVQFDWRVSSVEWQLDPEFMYRILGNLLSNAVKFSPPGARVKLENPEPDTLVVADWGVGINQETLEALRQEQRISTPGTEGESGNGLGIRQCFELLRLQGGSMTIDSKPGAGTRFSIRWPAGSWRPSDNRATG